MKTVAVLIPVDDYVNGKTVTEVLQDEKKPFKSTSDLRKHVKRMLQKEDVEEPEEIEILSLSECADYLNSSLSVSETWIAFVNVK